MSTLARDLTLLETRGLVRRASEFTNPVFRFKHALTREATYNTILQARRAELHRAAAETLAALYAQPDLEMVLTIADHWQRGNEDERALETILPHAQTLIYTGRSLSLTALLTRLTRDHLKETQARDLDIALADAHAARGEYEAARGLYENALRRTESGSVLTNLMYRIAAAAYHLADYEKALAYYKESFALALDQDDAVNQARASNGLALTYWSQGDTARALDFLNQSRALSEKLGETAELANSEFNRAGILMERGEYAAAIQAADHALSLDEKFSNTALAARTLQLLGACYFSMGEYSKSETYYKRALTESNKLGDTLGIALAHHNLAELYSLQGNQLQAISEYQFGIKKFRELKLDFYLAGALAGLAEAERKAAHDSGDPDFLNSAGLHIEEAVDLATSLHSPEREGVSRRVLAEILLERGEYSGAADQAERAVLLLEQVGAGLELKNAQDTLARVTSQRVESSDAALKKIP